MKEIKKLNTSYENMTEEIKREKGEESYLHGSTKISDSMAVNHRSRMESELHGANKDVTEIVR